MQRVKNITFSSILPVLFILFLMLMLPSSFTKRLRRGMMHSVIPVGKSVQRVFGLPKLLQEELSQQGVYREEGPGVAGKVIYRELRSYNNAVWIDVGTLDNDKHGSQVIGVNSPVISNGCLVGVVDEVCQKCSRVRLITDKKFTPSVQAIRGGEQQSQLLFNAQRAFEALKPLCTQQEVKSLMDQTLSALDHQLNTDKSKSYRLAKGELRGRVPSVLSDSLLVEGVGFNDQNLSQDTKGSILQEGDLLITTGLDGVFPAGIPVAIVSKIGSIERDQPFYSLQAQLMATHIMHLQTVKVLPSQGFSLN